MRKIQLEDSFHRKLLVVFSPNIYIIKKTMTFLYMKDYEKNTIIRLFENLKWGFFIVLLKLLDLYRICMYCKL